MGLGELVTQSLVVVGELPEPLVGQLEAALQRGVGCALGGSFSWLSSRLVLPLQLFEQVGLGVEPGA